MQELFDSFWEAARSNGPSIGRGLLFIIGGTLFARWAGRLLQRGLSGTFSAQQTMLARRLVTYAIAAVAVLSGVKEFGFDLSVLLGAAGILTVALGFASQTSASNLISGLFLIVEQPFVVGDVIRVGETTGEVLSIDVLSVKLRTFDNLYIRVPSELLIKSVIINLTHFPIRRFDLPITLAGTADLRRAQKILTEVAEANPLVLMEPAPKVFVQGFLESSTKVQLSAWATRDNYLEMNTSLQAEVKDALHAGAVEMAVPYRSLFPHGGAGEPIRIQVVSEGPRPPAHDDEPTTDL
jgi:small-conductance mechanosensitive channel